MKMMFLFLSYCCMS